MSIQLNMYMDEQEIEAFKAEKPNLEQLYCLMYGFWKSNGSGRKRCAMLLDKIRKAIAIQDVSICREAFIKAEWENYAGATITLPVPLELGLLIEKKELENANDKSHQMKIEVYNICKSISPLIEHLEVSKREAAKGLVLDEFVSYGTFTLEKPILKDLVVVFCKNTELRKLDSSNWEIFSKWQDKIRIMIDLQEKVVPDLVNLLVEFIN